MALEVAGGPSQTLLDGAQKHVATEFVNCCCITLSCLTDLFLCMCV